MKSSQEMSRLIWLEIRERWPQATPPSPVLALNTDGAGLASLGVVASAVKDILLILEVGAA